VRIDPDPDGSESVLLGQYLDYQRETMLSKTDGLTQEQLALKHAPSELTLAGLLYHLALVQEDWMEVASPGFRSGNRGLVWTGTPIPTGSSAPLACSNQTRCGGGIAGPVSAAGRLPPKR
jgi:hypothetical protein